MCMTNIKRIYKKKSEEKMKMIIVVMDALESERKAIQMTRHCIMTIIVCNGIGTVLSVI